MWRKGTGAVYFDLREAWYAQSLRVHFRRVSKKAFAPRLKVQVGADGLPVAGRRSPIADFSDSGKSQIANRKSQIANQQVSFRVTGDEGVATVPLLRPVQRLVLSVEDPAAGAVAVEEVVLLPAENLALGCVYTLDPPFEAKYPDTDGRELTDGQVTTQGFGDGKTVGWASWEGADVVAIGVDTGEVRDLDAVEAHVQGGGYAAVNFPSRTAVAVSEEGPRWTQVAVSEAEPTEVEAHDVEGLQCALGWLRLPLEGVRGRCVRLLFWPNGWLMVSEVCVLSKGDNAALNRPYSLRPQPTAEGRYPDNSGKLTDGVYSRSADGWKACAGFDRADPTITVDLGTLRRVSAARVHLVGGGPGGVWFPEEVTVSTSPDGQTWTPAGTTCDPPEESGDVAAVGFMGVTFDPREARFVSFHLKRRGWAMPDEVEVIP